MRAIALAEQEAKRQGIEAPTYQILSPDADDGPGVWWGWRKFDKMRHKHRLNWREHPAFTEIAVLVVGLAQKE